MCWADFQIGRRVAVRDFQLTLVAGVTQTIQSNPQRVYLAFARTSAGNVMVRPSPFQATVVGFTIPLLDVPYIFHIASFGRAVTDEWSVQAVAAGNTLYVLEGIVPESFYVHPNEAARPADF